MSKLLKRVGIFLILVLAAIGLVSVFDGGDDNDAAPATPTTTQVEEEATTTTEAPAPVEEEPEVVVFNELREEYVDADGNTNHGFGNGTTHGLERGTLEICEWGSDVEDAIANTIADVYPNGPDSTDQRELDTAAGIADAVLHVARDAAEGNIPDCETSMDLTITAAQLEEYEAHVTGITTPDGTYETDNRIEGGDHVENDGDLHDEDTNDGHDEGRTDAYFDAEARAYGNNTDNVTFLHVAPCYGYDSFAEAHADWLAETYPNGADEQTLDGDRDGGFSAFADGINVANGEGELTCEQVISRYEG